MSQERGPKAGQTCIYRHPLKIEPLGSRFRFARADRTRRSNWPDAVSVRSHLHDFSNERHVSRFESRSFDHNGHLNVLVHALEWPKALIKADRTCPSVRSPEARTSRGLTGCIAQTDRMPQYQHPVDSSKQPLATWHVRSIVTGCATASDWFRVLCNFSGAWPDAPVLWPTGRADAPARAARGKNWPDAPATSGSASSLASVHPNDFLLSLFLHVRRSGK
jgi:hypothetical protein